LVAVQNIKVQLTLVCSQIGERLHVRRHRTLLRNRFTDISHKLEMLHFGL